MNLLLRVRTEPERPSTVWLIQKHGGVTSGLLHGVMLAQTAEELATHLEALGVKVEREEWKVPAGGEPTPETKVVKQAELFQEK